MDSKSSMDSEDSNETFFEIRIVSFVVQAGGLS
jgi:hypothetical protein